jgi:hypothetical protein
MHKIVDLPLKFPVNIRRNVKQHTKMYCSCLSKKSCSFIVLSIFFRLSVACMISGAPRRHFQLCGSLDICLCILKAGTQDIGRMKWTHGAIMDVGARPGQSEYWACRCWTERKISGKYLSGGGISSFLSARPYILVLSYQC